MIDISKLNKARVLAALYNASHPQGLGFLHYEASVMTVEEASEWLGNQTYFDHLKGRIMKIDLSGTEFDPYLYDRDNGQGAALNAIRDLDNGENA